MHSLNNTPHPPLHRVSLLAIALLAGALLTACGGIVNRGGAVEETLESTTTKRAPLPPFPWKGEQMHFTVKHAGLNAELLQISVVVGEEAIAEDGTPYIPVSGSAESVSLARMLAKVNDSAEVFIDPATWQPIYAIKDLDENDEHRTYHVWFWPEEATATVEKHKKGAVHKKKIPIPTSTLDAVSWVYHVRAMDLEKGATDGWYIYDGWRLSKLIVVVQDKEDVWTPMGFYSAYRLDVYREKYDSHWPQGGLSGAFVDPELTVSKERYFLGNLWISDDDARLPVRLAIETQFGDLDLLIHAWTPPGLANE